MSLIYLGLQWVLRRSKLAFALILITGLAPLILIPLDTAKDHGPGLGILNFGALLIFYALILSSPPENPGNPSEDS